MGEDDPIRFSHAELLVLWNRWYDDPRHLAMDLRMIAANIDTRAGYETADGQIVRRAAACFDGLSDQATAEDTRLLLVKDPNAYREATIPAPPAQAIGG
jgi:hypothetical protein